MNDTLSAAANQTSLFAGTNYGALTGIHLAVILLFAVLVLIAIGYGIRLKRRRVRADRDVVEHAQEAGVPVQTPDPAADSLPADQRTAASEVVPDPAPAPATPTPATAPQPNAEARPEPRPETAPTGIGADAGNVDANDRSRDEPIAAAAPLEASPAAEAAFRPTTPATSGPADGPVTQLKGLGPKVAARLGELGITTVGQVAALTDDQADALDAQLGAFRGRMARDRWIEQSRFLAAGDKAGFEAVFGKL